MTVNSERLQELANRAGVIAARPALPLEPPLKPVHFATAVDREDARKLLISQRVTSADYKDPSKQFRRHLRTKKQNEKLKDQEHWVFTGEELSSALANVVLSDALGPSSVRLADALISEGADPTYFIRHGGKGSHPYADFLQHATRRNNISLISLLASRGVDHHTLGESLNVALFKSPRSLEAIEILLRHGADINSCAYHFQSAISESDAQLVELLLRAQTPLVAEHLTGGLALAVEKQSDAIVSLLLAHGADPNFESALALRKAVKFRNFKIATAIASKSICVGYLQDALELALQIPEDDPDRPSFLDMLLCAGASADTYTLQEALFDAVKRKKLDLVRLLISHGTSPCANNGQCLVWAVEELDTDLVEMLLESAVPVPIASLAVDHIPESASAKDAEKLAFMFLLKGANGEPLGRLLIRSVKRKQRSLTLLLVANGAPIDHGDAEAVRHAVLTEDLELLGELLGGLFKPESFNTVFPLIRRIPSKSRRFQATEMLLKAGVRGHEVDVALQAAVADETETRDPELIDLLLEHSADVNYSNHFGNCVQIAASQGDLPILARLCEFDPSVATLSPAVPMAFESRNYSNQSDALAMVELLLEKGASGDPVAETLIEATDAGMKEIDTIRVLLEHNVNVNHRNGLAIEKALTSETPRILELIVTTAEPNQQSMARLVPLAFADRDPDLHRANLLLQCCNDQRILDDALVRDLQTYGTRYEVLELLLDFGADVNCDSGTPIRLATLTEDGPIVELLVKQNSNSQSLTAGFKAAVGVRKRPNRMEIMQILLDAGARGPEVDKALISESKKSLEEGVELVQLLLDHGASVDFSEGSAIRIAIETASLSLLRLLLTGGPSASTLDNAFRSARQASTTDSNRYSIYESLLEAGYMGVQVSESLVEAVDRRPADLRLLRLLLKHGASVDHNRGECLRKAVAQGEDAVVDLLLASQQPAPNTINSAVPAAMGLPPKNRLSIAKKLMEAGASRDTLNNQLDQVVRERDHDLLDLLLRHGADPSFNSGACIIRAAELSDPVSLELLCAVNTNTKITTDAFNLMVRNGTVESSPTGVEAIQMLLEAGVEQNAINTAFIKTLQGYLKERTAAQMVGMLLHFQADVNHEDGLPFELAAKTGSIELFKRLLEEGPKLDAVLPRLLGLKFDEKRLVQLLGLCFEPEITTGVEDGYLSNDLLFSAMEKYPRGEDLIKLLLDNGCSPDSRVEMVLEPDFGKESVTALLWALSQMDQERFIADSVVLKLLQAGASAKFATRESKISPILVAAQRKRHAIVRALIKFGADVSARDYLKHSPLFYASRAGDIECVKALVTAGAQTDDGSVHEAAREVHPDVIAYLIQHGHRPDNPSLEHDGRSALGELCLKGSDNGSEWDSRVRRSIECLLDAGSDPLVKTEGRSILILALHNKEPYTITAALLEFEKVWGDINSDDNLYVDEQTGLYYSPTKYVEFFYEGTDYMRRKLISLLKAKRCKDRYFADSGDQPAGSCGLPKDIAEMTRRQKMNNWEHEQGLRRQREAATQANNISEERHQLSLQQEREAVTQTNCLAAETHQLKLQHESESEAQFLRFQATRHANILQQRHELEEQEHGGIQRRHRLIMDQETEQEGQRKAIMAARSKAELEHNKHLIEQQATRSKAELDHNKRLLEQQDHAHDARVGRERKLMHDREEACKREHERQKKLMGRENESMQLRFKLLGESKNLEKQNSTSQGRGAPVAAVPTPKLPSAPAPLQIGYEIEEA